MNTSRVMMELMQEQQAEIERLRAELEALRKQEPVAWMNVRNGFICKKPTNADYQQPLYPAAGAQSALGWLRAVDEAMVCSHLGTAEARDDYATAKRKLNELICWNVAVEKELGAQPAPSAPGRATMIERTFARILEAAHGIKENSND